MPPDMDTCMTPGDNSVINAAMMNQDSHVYRYDHACCASAMLLAR